jgi:Fic family protein
MTKPPFQITEKILSQVGSILELVGELKTLSLVAPPPKLRRENRIKTIHHSLAIEGNSLSMDQITAILENKRVIGPKQQITEVQNALKVYSSLNQFRALSENNFLQAHRILMQDLVERPGFYRSTQVGVLKGSKVSHVAPPHRQVARLMKNLFDFLREDKQTLWLIKACVFHYELEFIHPFSDGNGRMGRLWQQVILMRQSPLFEFISAETIVHKRQSAYYKVLEKCDKLGESTPFLEFSLDNILQALQEFKLQFRPKKPRSSDRVIAALEHFGNKTFSRRDYLSLHKGLSTATASRDLLGAVKAGLLKSSDAKAMTKYLKV